MLRIETGLVLLSLLIAFLYPQLGSRWFVKLERSFSQLSRQRFLSIVLIGFLALAVRAALLPIEPIPQPTLRDEFSYLLMSDTFAHGRVANPTHPMWIHFEATYVNQKPTYVSKYFPAQGVLLAIGQVMFGHPFWGISISMAIMCAAICWMLQGWFAPPWALLGALLAMIRLGTFSYWTNSYLGCALPAIGGSLVLGALPRMKRRQRIGDSLFMGFGLVLLASSRPLEGLIFSLPIVAALLVWIWNRKSERSRILSRTLVPGAIVLAMGLGALLYYFWRTTGNPFRTPYGINLLTQDPVPIFPWQHLRPIPQYRHPEMRALFTGWEMDQYNLARSHYLLSSIARAVQFYLFFAGPALTIPFIIFAADARRTVSKRVRPGIGILLTVFLISAFGLLLPIYWGPTYATPLTCVIYALLLAAMRSIRHWRWRDKNTGLLIVRAVPVICFLMMFVRAAAPLPGIPVPPMMPLTWCSPHLFDQFSRESVQAFIESKPGLQLALVHYGSHPAEGVGGGLDWVQNLANIDSQKVIWAHDMGVENEELIRYYKDRTVWVVEPETIPPKISPYSTTSAVR
jgi:predicted membrane protein